MHCWRLGSVFAFYVIPSSCTEDVLFLFWAVWNSINKSTRRSASLNREASNLISGPMSNACHPGEQTHFQPVCYRQALDEASW
ncbi:hypothetical protein B0H67DRAFT_64622 [Lasiosphaeris hirsuta]|uniref:Secreted protein n=1 Tax=Lasiosphaeris hirsuta TaxID=260670 RepID=A0AA40E8W9_9PEZI|nr:hypothetical protein B0H67DRAFT_64622 [Lasiosphaeris hirsuta]